MISDQKRQDACSSNMPMGMTTRPNESTSWIQAAKELGKKVSSAVHTSAQIEVDGTVEDWNVCQNRNDCRWEPTTNQQTANAYIDALKSRMTMEEYLLFLNDKKTNFVTSVS